MSNFKVGFSEVNINPPLGIGIVGYYIPRVNKGFLDDLKVKTIILELGSKKIALVSVDNCTMPNENYIKYVNLIEEKTGISKENVFIAATHTHTGPCIGEGIQVTGSLEVIEKYDEFLAERIADSVNLAIADLRPSKMGHIVGYAPERIAYIRRYKMKDGSTMTCPPVESDDIDHPIGTLDQRINVLRFDRENAQSIVLVNYGIHADTIGGELISADFPAWLSSTLEKALDGTKCIFFSGAQGDVGSTNVFPKDGDMNDTEISFDNEMKSPGMARFVGRAIAGTVLQVYDKVKYVDVDDIDIIIDDIKVPSNMPDPSQVPLAEKYKALHDAGRDCEIPYEAMELTTVVAESTRICNLKNGPEFFDIRITGVKIGPVAMVGIAGEPFTEIGVAIKDTPDWEMVLPCCITNGYNGYFPMKSAYDEGGYEARASSFKSGVAERIIDGGKAMLKKLKNN